jgi:hypothetical protein
MLALLVGGTNIVWCRPTHTHTQTLSWRCCLSPLEFMDGRWIHSGYTAVFWSNDPFGPVRLHHRQKKHTRFLYCYDDCSDSLVHSLVAVCVNGTTRDISMASAKSEYSTVSKICLLLSKLGNFFCLASFSVLLLLLLLWHEQHTTRPFYSVAAAQYSVCVVDVLLIMILLVPQNSSSLPAAALEKR